MKKRMLIIFEGADGSGKTNIAKKLSEILNIPYYKNRNEAAHFIGNKFYDTAYVEADYFIDLYEQGCFINGIILDRHIPSEYVYANVFKREYDKIGVWRIDNRLAQYGGMIIYCYKNKQVVYKDHLIKYTKIKELQKFYEKYLEQTEMPYLKLNTENEDLSYQITTIIKFLYNLGG